KHIRSHQSLALLVEQAVQDPTIALDLQDLFVQINCIPSFAKLRRYLTFASNLACLYLFLSCPIPPGLLNNISFHGLVFFKTNLPHGSLVGFLSAHSRITTLSLGPCASGLALACPLSVLPLQSHILAIECSMTCVRAISHPDLLRLTMEAHNPSVDVPGLLRSLPFPLTSLLYLTLDFYPYDYDIIDRIAFATPQVQSLKLIERLLAQRRGTNVRRAWTDGQTWHNSLCALTRLESLALRTASPLIRDPADLAQEREVVLRWVLGEGLEALQGHLMLSYVRIWYRTQTPGNGVITHWSRASGSWRNIVSQVHPPLDAAF
ncbi:hypothetical protein C8Q76DRAFT_626689, partial [Earliella scabrosa]